MRASRGATLLELIVALALTGLVLTVLAESSAVLLAAIDRTDRAAAGIAERHGGLLRLGEALQRVTRADTLPPPLGGSSTELWAHTRCRRADGATAPCVVELRLRDVRGQRLAELRFGKRGFEPVGFLPGDSELRYYDANRMTWSTEWVGVSRAPRAVAIVTRADTIVLGTGQ